MTSENIGGYIKHRWIYIMAIVAYILLLSREAHQEMSLFQGHLFLPIYLLPFFSACTNKYWSVYWLVLVTMRNTRSSVT